ncbi:Alpha/Beta hydrolase protein [Dactylonectria macrodidyma]|uniref:Carboxylic ester hydrolase n=1 Tax=Dactylonectria macrodidyma TaxID=307937 RepID=A0A9P9JIQ1_9HYPO|nr:Alpha/Beta hydrolase protein [Dactylonectria macrodidyma]
MQLSALVTSTLLALAQANCQPKGPLTIRTNTGTYTGLRNPDYPAVREFRNIPFAKPPIGSRRFLPPEPLPPSTKHHYSTRFPPSCPQFVVNSDTSFWNRYVPYLLIENGNQNHSSGLSAQTSSEDCLSLAIWTPYGVEADAKLPVAFFMTGGGFATGGIEIPGQIPASWVNRTSSHIVVTINYRANIFGFPNAAGLESQNLGILDQRAALEWVAENIDSFGGDPDSVVIWGQSAGSESTDYHNFAYWDNPIVKASYMQSGTSLKALRTQDYAHTNFTFVAKNLGCDFPDEPVAELECMRQVPQTIITNFVGQYSGKPSITFSPIADEVIIFSNYSARAAAGKISPNPAVIGNAANEVASLAAFPVANFTEGPWQAGINARTLSGWVCPTANTSRLRRAAGLVTYRYQYAGNFTNQSPLNWLGAYHASDLVMNFGTYGFNAGNSNKPSALQIKTSEAMQDRFFAFMKDPVNGLRELGWEPYEYGSDVVRFGAGVAVSTVSGYEIDGPCFGNGTYDSSP